MTDREFIQTILEMVHDHRWCDYDGCFILGDLRTVVEEYTKDPVQLELFPS